MAPYRGSSYRQPIYTRGYYGPGRPYGYARPYSYGRSYYPRAYYPRGYYARPYYVFRPRVSIGFGLWAGYPVAFSFAYGYPYYSYGYPYYSYGYPYYGAAPYPAYPAYPPYPAYSGYANATPAPATDVTATPSDPSYGGVSFEITPMDAGVYVDGSYVGVVSSFTPRTEPLALTPGPHRIEVRAPGYETAVFEVDIAQGEVIPYQGQLQPVRP